MSDLETVARAICCRLWFCHDPARAEKYAMCDCVAWKDHREEALAAMAACDRLRKALDPT